MTYHYSFYVGNSEFDEIAVKRIATYIDDEDNDIVKQEDILIVTPELFEMLTKRYDDGIQNDVDYAKMMRLDKRYSWIGIPKSVYHFIEHILEHRHNRDDVCDD
jgi:hypothetical protein